jgi:thioredoxin 1
MKTVIVTDADETTFQSQVLDSTQPVLVDFWADGSGAGQTLAPVLIEIARDQAGHLKIVQVNVDENPALAKHYHVETLPTLIYFMNGLVHDQIIGVVGKQEIVERLRAAR